MAGPGHFAGDVRHVGAAFGHGIHAVAGILIARAAVHAVVNRAAGINHLPAVEKIGIDAGVIGRNGRRDDPVGENHAAAAERDRNICARAIGAAPGIIGARGQHQHGQPQAKQETRPVHSPWRQGNALPSKAAPPALTGWHPKNRPDSQGAARQSQVAPVIVHDQTLTL